MPTKPTIEQALDRHQPEIMALKGVTGVGIGLRDAKPVILVMVETSTAELVDRLPSELDGHPVVIEAVGVIRAR